jgi:hypothetical protein
MVPNGTRASLSGYTSERPGYLINMKQDLSSKNGISDDTAISQAAGLYNTKV